jgi:hypothetical protein
VTSPVNNLATNLETNLEANHGNSLVKSPTGNGNQPQAEHIQDLMERLEQTNLGEEELQAVKDHQEVDHLMMIQMNHVGMEEIGPEARITPTTSTGTDVHPLG